MHEPSANHPSEEPIKNDIHISFDVDSLIVYTADSIPKFTFLFSPIETKDILWTTGSPMYELDLKSGKWTALYVKYGKEFKQHVNENKIWKDTITGDTYIGLSNSGLFHFEPKSGKFEIIKVQFVSSFYPLDLNILLGTANGLFYLNRKDGKFSRALNFPFGIWVNAIKYINHDSILLNDGEYTSYVYNAKTNTLKPRDFYTRPFNVDRNDLIKRQLPRIEGEDGFNVYRYHDETWYFSNKNIYFMDSQRNLYVYDQLPSGYLKQIKSDYKYLYLLFHEKFVIINKNYFKNKLRKIDLNFQNSYKDSLREELRKFEFYSLDSLVYYYLILKQDTFILNNTEFQNNLNISIRNRILNQSSKIKYYEIESKLSRNEIPNELKKYALLGLCMHYTRDFNLDKVHDFSKILNDSFPDFDNYGSKLILACVQKIINSVNTLKTLNLNEDQYLFELAKQKDQLVQCGWFGDNYFNFTIAENAYKELLRKYPASDYADNAEFYLLNAYTRGASGDIENPFAQTLIKKLNKFILKYPNSELIPEVRIKIADLYCALQDNVDKNIRNLKMAFTELEKIDFSSSLDSNVINICVEYKNRILKTIKQITFELNISSQKVDYKYGEDIEVRASLVNKTSVKQKIILYNSDQYFSTNVHNPNGINFIENKTSSDTSSLDKYIAPKDSIVQNIVLNKKARFWKNGVLGTYNLNPNELYSLTVFNKDRMIRSNELKIYINE